MQPRTARVAGVAAVVGALVVGGVALGLAASVPTSAAAPPPSCGSSAPKLTVQGTGNASATPDLLTVSLDIDVTDQSAHGAVVDDNAKASAVTAVLRHGGVADKDIQTSNVSIEPQYSPSGTTTGYEMTNTITAKLRDFSTAGSVLDEVTAAAGNAARIDSLTFSIEDPSTIEDTARTEAVHQAVSHARSMAQAAGEGLGPVCSLTDQSPDLGIEVPSALGTAQSAPSAPSPVPLQAGSQEVSAQITLVYALRPARLGP